MKTYDTITDLIGSTPLLKLNRFAAAENLGAEVYAKLEYFNPAGSVKDRIAYAMIDRRREERRAQARLRHHRADQRQHRHRPCRRRRRARLPHHHRHARDHERRAPPADEGLRRGAGAHRGRQGHEGRHCQGTGAGRPDRRTALSPVSSPTPRTPPRTARPQAPRSGTTPTARWTSSLRASAPAAR